MRKCVEDEEEHQAMKKDVKVSPQMSHVPGVKI